MSSSPVARWSRTVRATAPVAKALAVDALSHLRRSSAVADEREVEVPAPDGTRDSARHVHAQRVVPAPPATLLELVTDTDVMPEWLTLHHAWRGERPDRLTPGARFAQQISLMDIPAQARWHVDDVGPAGFALSGTGPMGITIGLWCTLQATATGTAVRLDATLDGPPVRGPVGLTAVRSVERALSDSLERLRDVASGSSGGGRLVVLDDPVLHEATGRLLEPTTPVLVGVGQVVRRGAVVPEDGSGEPVELAAQALRRAAEDAAASVDLLAVADTVHAVPSASWTYGDQAGAVAGLVGADDATTVQTSPFGGDGGQLAVNDAARRVADGAAHVVLVSGAESGATVAALQREGREPRWTRQADDAQPDHVIGDDRAANNEVETAVGLGAPVYVYALMESALRGAAGATEDEHRARIADLWSRHSAVAEENPYAWDPTARSAEEIATAGPDNRAVSDPYTKLLCANLQVDLAAAVVVTSVAAARAAGVPQDRWVFLHAGASATDEWFVSERDRLDASPAIAAAGAAALEHAGVRADQLGPVDLYSCFPAAVQVGAAALGLPWDDPDRPLSVTGGLTSAGGPGNNYGLHAVATMVPLLREQPEQHGLCTSLGWYATKHALGVYSATPPQRPFAHLRPVVDRPPSRPARNELTTPTAVVEALTVPRDRDGTPEGVVVSVLEPSGTRVLLRCEERADVETLTGSDVLRRTLRIEDGRIVVEGPRVDLPPPPPAPVRTHRDGTDVLVVTLDRPAARNAVDPRTAVALERAVDDAEADGTVRAIVLHGAGGTFSAGMDLSEAHRGRFPVTDRRGPLGLTGLPPVKPTVAAVEGAALAGGFELVLCADLVVAAEDARFGLPEAKVGLVAAAGGLWRTATRLPRAVALELALVGEPVPASRLAELGLVNRVVATGTSLETALELAHAIASNAPLSVAVGKLVVDAAPAWDPAEGFARQSELAGPVVLSDDAREGVAAFAERRAPHWTGR